MKNRLFASFLFVSLCFSPSHIVEASFCYPLFQKRKVSLLEQLNNPELSVKSVISPNLFTFLGDNIPSYTNIVPPNTDQPRQIEYHFTYIPAKKKKKKGQIILSFSMIVDLEQYGYDENEIWRHWIYWDSDVKDPPLHTATAEAIFNKIYQETYGMSLDEIIEQEVIPKTIAYGNKNELNYFEMYDAFDFNALLFKGNADRLRRFIAQVIESPDQTEMSFSKNESTDSSSSPKMGAVMRKSLVLSTEELRRPLQLKDVLLIRNTPSKTLNMSKVAPEVIVELLTDRAWRETITPEQVRQLDVRIEGIQYIFAPTFKHFVWIEDSKAVNIDTLSDSQIMEMDRDTFLRDVFLAGDLYVNGHVAPPVAEFITNSKRRVKELGYDTVMRGSLPKQTYNFIAKKLGFSADFENMGPSQRRALFKKQIEMMTNSPLQQVIVRELMAQQQH